MTDYNGKVRAVVLAALMVFSVFAGTVALSGTAAANVSSISGQSAQDLVAGQTSVTQEVTYSTTIPGDTTPETYTLDADAYEGTSSATIQDVSVSLRNADDELSVGTVSESSGDYNIDIQDSGTDGTTHSFTLVLTITQDTQGASTGTYDLTLSAASGASSTVSFDITSLSSNSDKRAGNAAGSGTFDTYDGEGYVFDGANVYQGESDIELGGSISGGVVKTAGNDEGVTLEVPDIPQDQATGRYTTNGSNNAPGVTVQRPRVTTLDVNNQYG
ncbi:surface glycoprotein, partial [Haloplanus vescus]